MKKYNLSEIMKNAWSIRRNKNISLSAALKQAWAVAKQHAREFKVFDLVKKSSAKIVNGTLLVSKSTASDILSEIKNMKHAVTAYLSGDCFRIQAQLFDAPIDWIVLKKSSNPYVSLPPVEVFRGTASEVDDFMNANKDKACTMEWEYDGKVCKCQGEYVAAHA